MPQYPKSHKWVSRLEGIQTMPHAKNNNKFHIKPADWFSETVAGLLGEWYMLKFKPLLQVVKTHWGDRLWEQLPWRFCAKSPVVLPCNQATECLLWAVCSLNSPHLGAHMDIFSSTMNPHMYNFMISFIVEKKPVDWAFQRHRGHSQPFWSSQEYLIRQMFCHVLQTGSTQFCIAIGPLRNHIQHCQQPRIDHGAFAALETAVNNSRNNKRHVRVI